MELYVSIIDVPRGEQSQLETLYLGLRQDVYNLWLLPYNLLDVPDFELIKQLPSCQFTLLD